MTNAMWKRRPVVASAVGGIQDQIKDGVHGLLAAESGDLHAYGIALRRLLEDRPFAERLVCKRTIACAIIIFACGISSSTAN